MFFPVLPAYDVNVLETRFVSQDLIALKCSFSIISNMKINRHDCITALGNM